MDENDKILRDKFAESLNHVNIGRGSDIVDVDRLLDKCLAIENDDPCEFAHEVSITLKKKTKSNIERFHAFSVFQMLQLR